jgi:hypothetical protein
LTANNLFRSASQPFGARQVLEKMHAPPKAADVPVITAAEMTAADGFLFGTGTRCARATAAPRTRDTCKAATAAPARRHSDAPRRAVLAPASA